MGEFTKSMGDEKTQLLGELYALRGGLSVVSQEKHIVGNIVNAANTNCRRADGRANALIAQAKRQVEQVSNNLSSKQRELDNAREKASEEKMLRKKLTANKWKAGFIMFFGILFLFGFGVYLIMIASEIINNDIKQGKKDLKEAVAAKNKIPQLEKEYKYLKTERDRLERVYAEVKKDETNKANDEKREILKKAREEIAPHIQASVKYIEALEETFGNLVDPRDWKNLDLLVYSIETRRADNIKEAFNYVDGEIRTDRLASAIEFAGKEICASIEGGLKRLNADISKGFSLVSDKLNALGMRMDSQNRQLAYLADVQRMNNALTAKASESSAVIAADVKQIRENSDYANQKLRSYY